MNEIAVTDTFRIENGVPHVGTRAIPWAEAVVYDYEDFHQRGFHVRFENGYTLSVQWGTGSYCENRDGRFREACKDAEIATWNQNDEWVSFGSDTVMGWVSVAQLDALIDYMISPEFEPTAFKAFCRDLG